MNANALGPAVWLGLALLVGYWIWLWAFFRYVRPRIMEAAGRRLGVTVEESLRILDAGTYDTTGDAALGKRGAIWGLDLVVLLAGTVGVAALVFVPAFLVAESGALLPIESAITGRGATISPLPRADMPIAARKASIAVGVRNTGAKPLARCRLAVAQYTAANGYLTGRSPWFDLAPGEARDVAVELDASKPPAGEHRYPVKLECDNERLAVADGVLVVR
ncbi:MAG: hypothetical protein IT520_02320 [Burkholderiales bacterium]|nr:hypothetical protein [Burkholderiales bacterium]